MITYPENWEDLYAKWTRNEISSKEFIEKSGYKTRMFYSVLAEYRFELSKREKNKTQRIDIKNKRLID